jgi:hypothetical protein
MVQRWPGPFALEREVVAMWPGLGTGVERWKVVVVVRRRPDPYVVEVVVP